MVLLVPNWHTKFNIKYNYEPHFTEKLHSDFGSTQKHHLETFRKELCQ